MPFIIGNKQIDELINKDKEERVSFEMKEDYNFKYIPESHFKHIVRNVQRQRRREDEERIWASFVNEQELNTQDFHKKDTHQSMENMKHLLQENMQDIDRELGRLQEDTLPERNKAIYYSREETTATEANTPKEKLYKKDKGNKSTKSTKSTNIPIPISQEDNVPNYKESKDLEKVSRSDTKKSLSDSLIIQKKYYTNKLLRATNQFYNNSNSDSSNNRDDIIYTQPDPLTIQKILSMQKKIAELLNEISFRLCRIPLPDGDDDLKRRQQQTIEFAIWFSRNYLYNLNRLITSIQRHIRIVSSRIGLKQYHKNIVFHQDTIKQKLIAAHQLLVHALNAYCKHIPNSILESHSTKLQDVLQTVYNLTDICDKVQISNNCFCSGDNIIASLGKDLQEKCDNVLLKLKLNLEAKYRFAQCKNVDAATVTLAPISPRRHKQRSNKKNPSGRLSMYNMDVDTSRNNQRKKNNLRRKTYIRKNAKGNNAIETQNLYDGHYPVPELLYPSPISRTSSSKDVIQTDSIKNANYLKEDDIKTMMDQVSADSENDSNLNVRTKDKNTEEQQSAVSKKNSSIKGCRSKFMKTKEEQTNIKDENVANDDVLIRKITTITKEHLATLAPVISDLITLVSKKQKEPDAEAISETSMETLIEFLQKYQSPKASDTKAILTNDNYEQTRLKSNGLSEAYKHDGNVRLVCITSTDKISKTTQYNVPCQTNCSSNNGEVSTLNSKDKVKLTVPKETEIQFLMYRNEYKKQCQLRPMYSSNTQNKPWDIVAWISDKLTEELIIEITEELQMNDVIQRLFEMEFQEF